METVFRHRPLLTRAPDQRGVEPSVLFGVISAKATRRQSIRANFERARPSRGRLIFVVGSGTVETNDDLLRVDVVEFRGVVRADVGGTPSGTISVLYKLHALLRHAAESSEDWLVRMDDDVLVNHRLSVRYAQRLMRHQRVYAGVFEWYNINMTSLRATGHGYGVEGSRSYGRRVGSCVPRFDAGRCVGPFAFAKGPWMLMSRDLTRAVLSSFSYSSIQTAAHRIIGKPRHRVHDDVLLGLSVSLVENVTYVRIPRKTVWLDRTPKTLWAGHLLVAHKPRDACYRKASQFALAVHHEKLAESYRCESRPPCVDCLHRTSHSTCTLEVRINATDHFSC